MNGPGTSAARRFSTRSRSEPGSPSLGSDCGRWPLRGPSSRRCPGSIPYNQHFVQDIGAFQIGLGAVLVLATPLADGLSVAFLGTGVGAPVHVVWHVIGRELGGNPEVNLPFFTLVAALLLAAGAVRGRRRRPVGS